MPYQLNLIQVIKLKVYCLLLKSRLLCKWNNMPQGRPSESFSWFIKDTLHRLTCPNV